MTVAEALARFERELARVETALDEGIPVELPDFRPAALTGPCTAADMKRLEQALLRLDACVARIERARTNLAGELEGMSRQRRVAAAYVDHA
jgi:hypothetical protein